MVTPATPHLLHGLVDEDADLPIDASPPLLALVPQVGAGGGGGAGCQVEDKAMEGTLLCRATHTSLPYLAVLTRLPPLLLPSSMPPSTVAPHPHPHPPPPHTPRWAATRCWR